MAKIQSDQISTTQEFEFSELALGDGSVSAPSLSFANDQDTGFWRDGADFFRIACGGVQSYSISNAQFNGGVDGAQNLGSTSIHFGSTYLTNLFMRDGSAAAPSLSFANDADTGIFLGAANSLRFTTGGTQRLTLTSAGNLQLGTGNLYAINGTAANPSISFALDQDTGMYTLGSGFINFTTNGTEAFRIDGAKGTYTLDGSAASPSISFLNDINTGFYRNTADEISISLGGVFAYKFQDIEFIPGADNSTTCGKASVRWSDVRSVLINGSDYGFANGYILREYPATAEDVQSKSNDWMKENANKGIQLINHLGETVMIFGQDGTIYAKGVKSLEEAPK